MSHLCWLSIFDLQIFLKVGEEANAEEQGKLANWLSSITWP